MWFSGCDSCGKVGYLSPVLALAVSCIEPVHNCGKGWNSLSFHTNHKLPFSFLNVLKRRRGRADQPDVKRGRQGMKSNQEPSGSHETTV